MAFAEVLRATVAMEDGGAGVGAQCLDKSDVGQAAAVGGAELPAQHLTGAEIHHERQVIHTGTETQVGEVLYPSVRFLGHGGVGHAVLRTAAILEQGVGMEMVGGCANLGIAAAVPVFLVGTHGIHLCQTPNAPCLVLAPS